MSTPARGQVTPFPAAERDAISRQIDERVAVLSLRLDSLQGPADYKQVVELAGSIAAETRLFGNAYDTQLADLDASLIKLMYEADPTSVQRTARALLKRPADDGVRWMATLALADANTLDGRPDDAVEALGALVVELRARGQDKLFCEALLLRSRSRLTQRAFAEAATDAGEAERIARTEAFLDDAVKQFGGNSDAALSRRAECLVDSLGVRGVATAGLGDWQGGASLVEAGIHAGAQSDELRVRPRRALVEAGVRLRAIRLASGDCSGAFAGIDDSIAECRLSCVLESERHLLEIGVAAAQALGSEADAARLQADRDFFDARRSQRALEWIQVSNPLQLLSPSPEA